MCIPMSGILAYLTCLNLDVNRIIDSVIAQAFRLPSWDKFVAAANGLRRYTDEVLNDAAKEWGVSQDVAAFRSAFHDVVAAAGALSTQIAALPIAQVQSPEDVEPALEHTFKAVLEELKTAFPNPDRAPGHEERQELAKTVLDKAEAAFIEFLRQREVPEERLDEIRASWNKLKPAIVKAVVVTGGYSL